MSREVRDTAIEVLLCAADRGITERSDDEHVFDAFDALGLVEPTQPFRGGWAACAGCVAADAWIAALPDRPLQDHDEYIDVCLEAAVRLMEAA